MADSKNLDSLTTEQLILLQLQKLPDALKNEVLDFIGYLLAKHYSTNPENNKP